VFGCDTRALVPNDEHGSFVFGIHLHLDRHLLVCVAQRVLDEVRDDLAQTLLVPMTSTGPGASILIGRSGASTSASAVTSVAIAAKSTGAFSKGRP